MTVGVGPYEYRKTRVPDGSGAAVYSFLSRFMLPVFTLPGTGTPYTFRWNPVQPEQLYYNQSQRMDGIIGVQAGQIAQQGLIDNRGING